MSDTPETVSLVWLVQPGQGYAPIHLPRRGIKGILPGRAYPYAKSLAKQLLREHPQFAVVTRTIPGNEAPAEVVEAPTIKKGDEE